MEIRDFEPGYAAAFKALNEAWITRHYAVEPKDEELLGDPLGKIIAKGGLIPFAVEDGEAVGCCAMIPMADGGYRAFQDGGVRGAPAQGHRHPADQGLHRARPGAGERRGSTSNWASR